MAAYRARGDSGDEDSAEKMAGLLGPGQIDQMIRQGIQFCWMSLPKARRNLEELDKQVRRIVDRALKDFRDDYEQFGRSEA